MKKIIYLLLAFLYFTLLAKAQVLRPFGIRYNNASVRGNIVYVANNMITSLGGVTTEVAPGGSSVNNGKNALYVDIDNAVPVVKLPFGSLWNYHGNNSAPPNDGSARTWTNSAYTLTGPWNVNASPVGGAGKYGFGGTQATCMPNGGGGTICNPNPPSTKYTSYYFRKTVSFTAAELSTTYTGIQMDLLRDDGIVVYINGVERIRNNMPTGAVVYSTLASTDITTGANETVSYTLSPAFFSAGVNTISVEVHLKTTTSTDMSFDMQVSGVNDNGTFSSSSADLNLPACSKVLFAGLYWGASQGTNGTNVSWRVNEKNIKLKIPGAGSYSPVVSAVTDYHDNTLVPGLPHTGYRCFTDITSLINSTNPNGTYILADLVGPLGIANGSGGWTIVVAYSNPVLQPRNLTVFDGSVIINGGAAGVAVPVNGFLTPPSGPVSCELGAIVYDGDRASLDSFLFKENSNPLIGTYVTQTPNATSKNNDMWNSTISYKGADVTTRNPLHYNTLGYDADIIDVQNTGNLVLGNSQTSASIRFSSPSENYFVHCLTTSISVYNPSFAFDKTATDINGGTTLPGDNIRYQINYKNVGNDVSTGTTIVDNIPIGASYVPGSLKINSIAKTDGTGDDQADFDVANNRVIFRIGTGATSSAGGTIATNASGTVQFDVLLASSCNVLSCVGSVQNIARINYIGQTSGSSLHDSSGVSSSGCITPGAVVVTPVGQCYFPKDTLLINKCPVLSMLIPYQKYGGYVIYSRQPFIPANVYNPTLPVTSSHVYWAYFDNGAGCSDTIKINMILTPCPDIDDDNDGIPDYVEFNDPRATQDANSNGIPNWNDPTYPGWVDNNSDNVNDNFDWGADSDNDGIINFRDTDFWLGFVDVNGDGINDKSDRDLDGIPNQYDLDSDNDGIPDTVESYGVDTNGDGRIDNYSDTDNDGLSQNVDFNSTGVSGSRNGLDAQDRDGDGIPNYLDADSDNDGIPDVVEAGGTDANNDGMIDGFIDNDGDGLSDDVDGDVGNDGVAENSSAALLITGPDTSPANGRADSYPNKNMDHDFWPNPYDLDSDGDGIVDVIEGGLTDLDLNGIIDGTINATTGWSVSVSALTALNLYNTDGRGNPDYLDIDADDDGIPDNIEGQTTNGYKFPAYADSDNDGIDNTYDLVVGFGGSGILLADKDVDGIPDYRDLDTDSDGAPDIIEGNDFNRNGIADDNVTLTLLDTDGDGLDNRFDSLTSGINLKGTSYNMGTGGSTGGDVSPGARCPVQKTNAFQTDRDWRYTSYVLNVKSLLLAGLLQNETVALNWDILSSTNVDKFEIERSTDNIHFDDIQKIFKNVSLNRIMSFKSSDNVSAINSGFIFYRLKVTTADGQITYSNVVLIRKSIIVRTTISVHPNPTSDYVMIGFNSEKDYEGTIKLMDNLGKVVLTQKQRILKGINSITLTGLSRFSNATYILQIVMDDQVVTQKLVIQNR